jgi:hypothetical protein
MVSPATLTLMCAATVRAFPIHLFASSYHRPGEYMEIFGALTLVGDRVETPLGKYWVCRMENWLVQHQGREGSVADCNSVYEEASNNWRKRQPVLMTGQSIEFPEQELPLVQALPNG